MNWESPEDYEDDLILAWAWDEEERLKERRREQELDEELARSRSQDDPYGELWWQEYDAAEIQRREFNARVAASRSTPASTRQRSPERTRTRLTLRGLVAKVKARAKRAWDNWLDLDDDRWWEQGR